MKPVQFLPIAATTVIGLLASFALLQVSVSSEQRFETLNLQSRARDHLSVIETDLQAGSTFLETIRDYFESSGQPVSRAEFGAFVGMLHRNAPGLRDVSWAPHVTLADRPRFEQAMRGQGFPGFEIRERAPDQTLVRAGTRADYYPVLFQEPPDGVARSLIGLDLATGPERLIAIGRAIQTGVPAATVPLTIPTMHSSLGILAYVPEYRTGKPGFLAPQFATEAGKPAPDGLVLAAFELGPMLDNIIAAKHRLTGLDVYLLDPAGVPGHRGIYWRPANAIGGYENAGSAAGRAEPAEDLLREQLHLEGTVTVIDRHLRAIFRTAGGGGGSIWRWRVMMAPAGGLMLTALSLAYLTLSLRRTRRLEALTRDLQESSLLLQREAEKISHLARHDSMTGLLNRQSFEQSLQSAVAESVAAGAGCAVLLVDLDRFKPINDVHGHAVGDAVLCEVANRLRALTRSGTIVSRLGGDEFALIVTGSNVRAAGPAVAWRLIRALTEKITTGGLTLEIGASVGIAFCPEDGLVPERLLHAADLAMYSAKRQERGTLCHFTAGMDEEVRTRVALEADLRLAIARGDIVPYYQPVVRLPGEALVGFEILARWHHPERGTIGPGVFIPVAESANLISDMTYLLLRQACADAAAWPDHLTLALNLSGAQLMKRDLPRHLLAILADAGISPGRLEIEVTEGALLSNPELARASLLELRRAGMRVALDDFGTGYSSLVHLRQLPLDKIKIDQSFVMNMMTDTECATIVAVITGLALSLGLESTGEGIESAEIARELAALGCTFGQGYHFARPMAAAIVRNFYGFEADAAAALGETEAGVLRNGLPVRTHPERIRASSR